MLPVLFALMTLGVAPIQSAPQPDPTTATTLPPVTSTAPQAEPETRRVCRFETVTGSNRRTRVCRDLPRQGVQDQATRDFMRDSQRVRMPDS